MTSVLHELADSITAIGAIAGVGIMFVALQNIFALVLINALLRKVESIMKSLGIEEED